MDTTGGKRRGGGGSGVMNWVIGIDMYTLKCLKLMEKKKKGKGKQSPILAKRKQYWGLDFEDNVGGVVPTIFKAFIILRPFDYHY